jgi:quercetin dioxygenase-like cupin family protein
MTRFRLLLACLTATLATNAFAQDMAATARDNAKVVLENDRVRVIELNMPPGASTGMHSHDDNLVVFLSGGSATQTMARKAGEVLWSDPVTHDTKNTGKSASRTLVIELKDAKP